jgi:YgiT-type zinc finger domain-containing protein
MKKKQSLCPICHGGYKLSDTTTFTVELGFGIVVVLDVPAQVYDLCRTDR